jgi:hypothetical protein
VIELVRRMEFYAAMLKTAAFTRSAFAVTFVLLYQQQRPQVLRGLPNCCCATEPGRRCKPGVAVPGAIRLRPDRPDWCPMIIRWHCRNARGPPF